MARFVRSEAGMTLVELLIAMTLMAIGISAIVAGFSSGIFAIGRADQASTAAALADQQMEIFRQYSYDSITVTSDQGPSAQSTLDGGNCNTSTFICPGPDNREYWVSTDVETKCAPTSNGPMTDPPCSGTEEVKLVTVTVKDAVPSQSNPGCPSGGTTCAGNTIFTESSTFDSLMS